MSAGLLLKVVAGLATATLAAVLLEHYGLRAVSSPRPARLHTPQRPFPAPGSEDTNIFWGLQISDLHISKFFDPRRATDLEKFCSETVDVIQPALVLATAPGIRALMSSAIAYLCGHLHLLGGLMPVLHTQHPKGTLELELGDWKENRRYRIFAFDHDLFSFADLVFDNWPVVLITNPKSFLYSSSTHEPLERLFYSTHIRILAFSPSSITSVTVKIDDVYLGNAVHLSGPIFILKWNPRNYSEESHVIKVIVQDSTGRNKIVAHEFSIKGDIHVKFDFMPSFILLTDHYVVAQILFILIVVALQFLLMTFRHFRKIKLKGTPGCISLTIFSFNVLSKTDIFCYSVLFLNFYIALGPWFVGEIIDGKIGCCFSFGVLVDGHFFQGSMTYVIGIIQIFTVIIPLWAYLCWTLLLRCQGHTFSTHLRGRYLKAVPGHALAGLFYLCHLGCCVLLWKAYGTTALVFSPTYGWLALLAPILVRLAWTLSPRELRAFAVELRSHQGPDRQ